MRTAERLREERGLMGKIMFVWLALLVVFLLAAWDTGSILLMRYKVSSAAGDAAFEAASVYKTTHNIDDAKAAALDQIQQQVPGAKLTRDGFVLDPITGNVTITITKRASTLLAGRIGFLKHFTKAVGTGTGSPPTL
ncbi:MAG TPA: hypothetical protein VFC04_01510 [Actinomycetota bacterium]|nr:hypothetical protein [Actinomycetota bacterium]